MEVVDGIEGIKGDTVEQVYLLGLIILVLPLSYTYAKITHD